MLLFGTKKLVSPLLSKTVRMKINKRILLPPVLYGCETMSLTLGEGHVLQVSENKYFDERGSEKFRVL
jgi:hypothetical protein